ncbi:MAG: hypothetical protein FJX74_07255 [Armatimonadetes bacterium]|nr:hypothetical protein [Armatimonadota bacterium]
MICREAPNGEPQGVADVFDRADALCAVIDVSAVGTGAGLQVRWQSGTETIAQQDVPTVAGLMTVTTRIDRTGMGGFEPREHEVQLLAGGRVVAARRFTVGRPAANADEETATGPAIALLQMAQEVTEDGRPVTPVWSFARATPCIHACWRYSGFQPGSRLRVTWAPPGGGLPIAVDIPLGHERGTASCSLTAPPGGAFAGGQWTVAISIADAATPLISRRFTVE